MTGANSSTQKVCGKCGVFSDLSAFNKNKNRPDGLAWDCRQCNKIRSAARFAAKQGEYNETSRANYQTNKPRYLANSASWAAANKEKRGAIAKRYVKNNPEQRKRTATKYRIENPGLYAAHFKARQQRKRKAMPAWANAEAIKAIYDECARISKDTGVRHHVDHYYPLKNDYVCGLHNEYNLRIVTAFDNLSKGNSLPTEEL